MTVNSAKNPGRLRRITGRTSRFTHKYSLYIMAIVCIAFVLTFAYFPLLGWVIAFVDYRPGYNLWQCTFEGFKYFRMALNQPDIMNVIKNTLAMSGLGLLCAPLPAFLAIALSEMKAKRYSRMVQTVTTFPNFISWVLVFSVMFALFSPGSGLVNQVLYNVAPGGKPIDPLGNYDITYFFQTAIGQWKGMGFTAIIYLASLAGVDPGLYEAAEIDGASRMKKILYIKIPSLYPTFFTLLVLAIGQLLNNGFEQYFVFYNGLVGSKLEVLDYYVYKIGFQRSMYPLGTAIGIMKTAISITLLVAANQVSKKVRGVSIL